MESDVMPQTVVEGQKWDHLSDYLHRLVDVPYQPHTLSVLVPPAHGIAVSLAQDMIYAPRERYFFFCASMTLPNSMGRLLQSMDLGQS